MSLHTTEHDLHHGHLAAYIAGQPSAGGLGWQVGSASQVDTQTLLIREDLMAFLAQGNASNESSWKSLVNDCGRDEAALWEEVRSGAMAAMKQAPTHVQLLREGMKIRGHHFSLWNPAVGRNTQQSQLRDFSRNCLRMTNEVVLHAGFKKVRPVSRRPDQAYHINGIYYAMAEIKARQTGQAAALHGRDKIIGDYREFAGGALEEARAAWDELYAGSKPWPGYTRLPESHQRLIRAWNPAYEKAAWVIAMDMGAIWLMPSFDAWLAACDESLSQGIHPLANDRLRDDMLAAFTRMPAIADLAPTEQVEAHLAGLLHPIRGVNQEISLFHYPRTDKVTQQKDFLRPRIPQRVFMERLTHRTEELYSREHEPTWVEEDLRAKIREALPLLDPKRTDEIVSERLKYRNGREAYSILFQGAAGLGKTNLAVWSALYLYNQLEPLLPGQNPEAVRRPLFDRVVILTDRTELRDNIAEEAERTLGSRDQILLANTKPLLKAALTGEPLPSHVKARGDIVVVNLQKFPGLIEDLAKEGVVLRSTVGRTAFIIDEVHRSQNGNLNEQATSLFVESLGDLARSTNDRKKNLIVGLTATPSDTVLARFGEWHAPVSVSDPNRWKPYFAYALRQAIDDGFVLDPTLQFVGHNLILNWDGQATAQKAGGRTHFRADSSTDQIYENPHRQALVAGKFCKSFVEITMQAIPHGFSGVRVGTGKAMVTVPSIKAAIGMQAAIKKSLNDLAANAKGTPWEKYAHIVAEVAEERVFVLYSDPQVVQGRTTSPNCEEFNDGLGEKEIIKAFRCSGAGSNNEARNSIIVVVDKLLTGFDEPTLHTLLIDRSLTGINLFQAACRVNRKARNKYDTLVIQTCHDDTVSKEFFKVFTKYGGLALSELDGQDLLDRLDSRRQDIVNHTATGAVWNRWKNATLKGKPALARDVSDILEALKESDPAGAQEIRKTVGGYLAGQRVARSILDLEEKHTNSNGWLDCLREIHTILRSGNTDDRQSLPIAFEVERIELDDTQRHVEEGREERRREKFQSARRTLVDALMEDEGSLDGVGFLEGIDERVMTLQEIEERKRERSQEIRRFLDDLYARIDAASVEENNDAFRKAIRNGSFFEKDHQEQLNWFMRLQSKGADFAFRRQEKNRRLIGLLTRWRELMLQEYRERMQ